MKVALVIPIYNRVSYVRRCFASLEKLTVKPDIIFLVDDASTDKSIIEVMEAFYQPRKDNIYYELFEDNKGVKRCLLHGIEAAFKLGADFIITLDSDAIVKPDFVERLVKLHTPSFIVSGFNNPKEPIIKQYSTWAFKAHANGINMCFDKDQYEAHIKPALLAKSGNWDYMASESAGKVAITVPSCVQHIGLKSSMGHVGADVATDFKILSLPNVTLFGIDSHDVPGIQRAAEICQRDIAFGAVVLITKDLFTPNGSNEQRRKDYSRFMLKELTKHFNTSHVLTIHADGYVLRPEAWCDEWLQYDYIGASWNYKDGMNCGNGGFSLRSKKLCDILAEYELEFTHPEDYHIGRTYRPALEKLGIKFAPEEVANRFSIEAYGTTFEGANKYSGQFGFHSVHVDFSTAGLYGVPPDALYKKTNTVSKNRLPLHR